MCLGLPGKGESGKRESEMAQRSIEHGSLLAKEIFCAPKLFRTASAVKEEFCQG